MGEKLRYGGKVEIWGKFEDCNEQNKGMHTIVCVFRWGREKPVSPQKEHLVEREKPVSKK